MIRSLVFTTQGRLHSKDIDMFLMPTLLSDTNLFLWVDLESPTAQEAKYVLEDVFHFHPLSIEDCVIAGSSICYIGYMSCMSYLGCKGSLRPKSLGSTTDCCDVTHVTHATDVTS
jgi:hypothetical protein